MQKIFLEKYELVIKIQQRVMQSESVSCFKFKGENNIVVLSKG